MRGAEYVLLLLCGLALAGYMAVRVAGATSAAIHRSAAQVAAIASAER